jgi:hypothetical protein
MTTPFNEYDFIESPDEGESGLWICQDCWWRLDPKDVIRTGYICEECKNHTLGPFKNERECEKALYACKGLWTLFKRAQDEDGVVMPGWEDFFRKEKKYNQRALYEGV